MASVASLSAQANRTILYTSTESSAFSVNAIAVKSVQTPAAVQAAFSLACNGGKLKGTSVSMSSATTVSAKGTLVYRIEIVPTIYSGQLYSTFSIDPGPLVEG
jgi:hypothetical protein